MLESIGEDVTISTDKLSVRYIVETGLDLHIVSDISVVDDKLKVTMLSPMKATTTYIPLENISKITKEYYATEDVTEAYVKELVHQ